jgi:hypothetical protein
MVINPHRLARLYRLPLPLKNVIAEERLVQVRGGSKVDAKSERHKRFHATKIVWVCDVHFHDGFLRWPS